MKILLTGASGYIGKRLLPLLLSEGHQVVCAVRDKRRIPETSIYQHPNVFTYEVDFLNTAPVDDVVKDIDAAYYLIHSMASHVKGFERLEELSANNFVELIEQTRAKQIIFLGGITNAPELSKHLRSRQHVEEILSESKVHLTTLRAGIIVGSGSASFEIIRDLVEKLPLMITPRWVNTKTQPIAVRNVLEYLVGVLGREETFDNSYDIGGPDILSYKEMLLQYAAVRSLRRIIITVPVLTPRISSYWLYFVTSTTYSLAVNLVNSMKVEVIAKPNNLREMLGINLLSYKEAVRLAFQKIEQNDVVSSWKDSFSSSFADTSMLGYIDIPSDGCFIDTRTKIIRGDEEQVLNNIWAIGGERGWYYGDWLWNLRGFFDKLAGGVGLRRGRTNRESVSSGDTLDFWRVLVADRNQKRLLLYAEMKLPGEAWLEFRIVESEGKKLLKQTATFRPHGLVGRMYWYLVLPFHYFIFEGMANNLLSFKTKK